ncbi:17418_t:CDS:2, partial [Funneliformis caledonium]
RVEKAIKPKGQQLREWWLKISFAHQVDQNPVRRHDFAEILIKLNDIFNEF